MIEMISEKSDKKITVVLGASPNPARYSFLAAGQLLRSGYPFIPVGIKTGVVFGKQILDLRKRPRLDDVDTVTVYIGGRNQPEWYDYILSLKPKRVIFNPGAENPEFEKILQQAGVETVEGCTLVMLRTGQYG